MDKARSSTKEIEVETKEFGILLCNPRNRKAIIILLCLVLYIALTLAVYMPAEGWGAGEALYYAVVVVTTVGYGDFLPAKDSTKLLTVVFVHFAIAIVAGAISEVIEIFTKVQKYMASRMSCEVFNLDWSDDWPRKLRQELDNRRIDSAMEITINCADGTECWFRSDSTVGSHGDPKLDPMPGKALFPLTIQASPKSTGLLDKKAHQRKRRLRVAFSSITYIVCILVGTVFFANVQSWEEDDGNKWVNGLYLTVITLSTVGFGDFSPDSDGAKVFGCILMLVGIPAFGSVLASVTDSLFGEMQEEAQLKVIRGSFTPEKFQKVDDFVTEMRKKGIGNYRNQGKGSVSRFEFLAFMMVQNGLTDLDNIRRVMQNFDSLDRTGDGFIRREDLVQSKINEPSTPISD